MEEAKERKKAKYADLECRRNGWKARCEPIEVGCMGFAGQSLHRLHVGSLVKEGGSVHSALPGTQVGADHPRLGLHRVRVSD
ncbi:hypothetical protein NFI96_020513, partial [Prochilodus magdalenae]